MERLDFVFLMNIKKLNADLQILLRLTRIRAYLLTLLSSIALIFLISPQNLLSFKTVIVFLANLFLTAFVYAFNDVEDAEDDHEELEKRKRNPISNGDLTNTQGYSISFLLLIIGLSLLLLTSPLVFFLGLFLALTGFFYSWKPVRLKSIPILDLISHVICLGGLQFFITYLTFRSLDLFSIPFLMIIIPFSITVEIFYEFKDFNVDKKTNITNTIQKFRGFSIKKLLFSSSVLAITGFIIIFFTIPSVYAKIFFLSGSILVSSLIISKMKKSI